MLRVAVDTMLKEESYVCLIAPTRDLVRQHVAYFEIRLAGTPLGVAQVHGGMSPAERKRGRRGYRRRLDPRRRAVRRCCCRANTGGTSIDRSSLLIIDDVNAFDEREHLRLLEDLDCPMLFASATPSELRPFLTRIGAMDNVVSMKKMPFDVIPTTVHKPEGRLGRAAGRAARARRRAHSRSSRAQVAHLRHQPHPRRRP